MSETCVKSARSQVVLSWLHSSVSLATLFGLFLVAGFMGVGTFGDSEEFIDLLITLFGMAFLAFLLSEVMVVTMMNGYRANREDHPRFVNAVERLCGNKKRFLPRLYILQIPVPNAAAFGWGFMGQSAIGVSQELCDLLDDKELEAVLAHELGHLRMRDVGTMTVVSMLLSAADRLAQITSKNSTTLAAVPLVGALLPIIALLIRKFILPMIRSSISQEREYCADALSAIYTGSPDPLASALRKLEKWKKDNASLLTYGSEVEHEAKPKSDPETSEDPEAKKSLGKRVRDWMKKSESKDKEDEDRILSPMDDLFISHPHTEQRIAALEAIRARPLHKKRR